MTKKSQIINKLPPLERYLAILEVVAASNHCPSLTEISDMLNLPKPTVHRLVGVLEEVGALVSDNERQRCFSIGKRMRRILHLGQSTDVIRNFAQIACDALTDKAKETSYIVKLGHDAVHTITRSVPDKGYRLHVFPGEELPAHAAASAKAIIAFQDEATINRLLTTPLKQLTPYTTTDIDKVKEGLNQVKKQGYAICSQEIDIDVLAYACPVQLDKTGVIYSIGITAPINRMNRHDKDFWVDHLQQAAKHFKQLITTSSKQILN